MRPFFRRGLAAPTPDSRYRTARHVVSTRQGERAVLLDVRRGEYYGVDDVGEAIWRMLGRGASLAELVDDLEREYEAPRAQLERDAAEFVALLERRKLLERA